MKQKGAMFLLQVEISSVYTTIAAMRSTSMTINSETVEVTDKAFLFRELLENAGISSVSVKSSGVCSDDASYEFIKTKVLIGAVVDCKLLSNSGEIYAGAFLFTSLESSGEFNKEELFNLTIESANTTSIIDNYFLLLEDGGFFLLEDGGRIMLEAA